MSKTLRGRRWTGWSKRKPSMLRPFPSLRVEELEARTVPALFTWTGAGANANWSNGANWVGGTAPTGAVGAGDTLNFPSGGVTVRTTNNDIANGTFFSITIADSNYVLAGKAITLGSSSQTGNITVGASVLNSKIDLNIALGGATGFYQVTVNNNANFAINGVVSGSANNDLLKAGVGVLNVAGANSTLQGNVLVNAGTLAISNSKALGSTSGNTTVATNATLALNSVTGTITEPLIVNGPGVSNLGALRSIGGANTWAGTVLMDSNSTFGADLNTSVNITGVVSDSGSGRDATKEGLGTVQFSNANTYRGITTINEGVLAIANSKALGTADRTAFTGTIVNQTITKAGQLRILGGATGFTVLNERLQLHGDAGGGEDGTGALLNFSANNEWAGPVVLGGGSSNVTFASIGAADTTDLIISGIVQGSYDLRKVEPGRIILNNANSYTGSTFVFSGILNIRDSRGLGFQPVTVSNGGTLELEVEAATTTPRFGYEQSTGVANGRDLWLDSVTLDPNRLIVDNPIQIDGLGSGNAGALRSRSGINIVTADVNLSGPTGEVAIGVDADQRPGHPTPTSAYWTDDYKLTITGSIHGPGIGTIPGPDFVKRGLGNLVLPSANDYTGETRVEQGWITVQNNNALGAFIVGLGETVQPRTIVSTDAALHLKKLTPASPNLVVDELLTLSGTGPAHPYTFIGGKGALLNIGGDNTWAGDVVLQGSAGIGAEQVETLLASELTVSGSMAGSGGLEKLGSRRVRLLGDGTYTGDVVVTEGTLSVENDTALGRSSSGTNTSQQTFSSTPTNVASGAVIEFGPGRATNNGGIAAGIEVYDETLTLNASAYQVLVAGDPLSAMFTLDFTTVSGSASTIPLSITATAAEVQAALVNALLTMDGQVATVTKIGSTFTIVFGNALSDEITLTATPSGGAEVQIVDGQSSVINVSSDNALRGGVSLNAGTRIRTNNDSRLGLLGSVSDAASSHLVKRGNGTLILGGTNSYRGVTLISEGIATLMDNRALGFGDSTEATGTIVRPNAQLQFQGNLTVSNEALVVGGSGPDSAAVPDAIPVRWLQVGGAPINQGQTPGNTPVTGRVTGTAVDPTDPNVIYIATAGGGAWKTKDGGKTWLPLFDLGAPEAPLNGGSIFVALDDPRIVYYGTGESNNAEDSYAGSGVYRSTDSGRTWTLLTNGNPAALANPLAGQSVSKVIAQVGDRFIYAATSDAQSGTYAVAAPGIWRYDLQTETWFNMTGETSVNRATRRGTAAPFQNLPPNTPGPDDDYRVQFPQSNVSWTDMVLVYAFENPSPAIDTLLTEPILYVALMEDPGGVNGGHNSGVFRNENPDAATPIWYSGDKVVDSRNNVFPTGPFDGNGNPTGFPRNGRITLAAATNGNWSNTTVWAAIARPTILNNGANDGRFLEIQRTLDSGMVWAPIATPPEMADVFGVGFQGHGQNSATMVAVDLNTLYIGGSSGSHVWHGTGGGTTWTDISNATGPGSGPFAGDRAMAVVFNRTTPANSQLILGGDGGVYRYTPNSSSWEDINGTLAISLYNDIAVDPSNYNAAAGGTQATGTAIFDGSTDWIRTDGEFGGDIYIHPVTPNVMYHVQHYTDLPNLATPLSAIRKSEDGGNTWNSVFTQAEIRHDFPIVLDPINPQRVLLADRVATNNYRLRESLNGLDTAPVVIRNAYTNFIRHIALGGYQGPWVDDPDFDSIVDFDRGTNAYDPSTIYISDGSNFSVTKDNGLNWVDRPIGFGRDTYTFDFSGGVLKYKDAPVQISFSDVTPGAYLTARTVREGVGSRVPFARQVDERQTLDVVYPNGFVGTFDLTVSIAATGAPYNTPAKTFTLDNIPIGTSGAAIANLINIELQNGPANTRIRGDEYQGLVFSNIGNSPNFTLTVNGTQTGAIVYNGVTAITVNAINAAFAAATPVIGGVVAELHGVGANAAIYLHYVGTPNTDAAQAAAAGTNMEVYVREAQRGGNGTVTVGRANGAGPEITSVTVDPANHDIVYVTTRYADHILGPSVFRTGDAARTWTDISGNGLPTIALHGSAVTAHPAWSFEIDPRDNTLYVGTDVGVYVSRDTGATWTRFGNGMPNVSVRDLELNLSLSTLSAGTYGRSMYQLFLDSARADSGALRTVSGNSTWTGPVRLTAHTRIETDGTQGIQNGIAASSLNIIGSISDDIGATIGDFDIYKEGEGTLIFSGKNTYGGLTEVRNGVLEIRNPEALGDFDDLSNTIVFDGAALELATDLYREPILLNGSGYEFNDHFGGSLRNISGINTYTGTVTLNTPTVTIGVNSGTQLTIGDEDGDVGDTDSTGVGTVTDNGTTNFLVKEQTGTLVFANANTYTGTTQVVQGALRVAHEAALGGAANGTFVFDGAQLQISRNNVTRDSTVVTTEDLYLSGTGIFGTGAFLNVRGDFLPDTGGKNNDNTWRGLIEMREIDNFSPATDAPREVSYGSSDRRDTLFIDTPLQEENPGYVVNKVGLGRVTFVQDNMYTGQTNVLQGYLRVMTVGGLGVVGSGEPGTVVSNGATLELDGTFAPLDMQEDLLLFGDGVLNVGALNNVIEDNTYSAPITIGSVSASPVNLGAGIGAVAGTRLTILGLLQDPVQLATPVANPSPGRLRKLGDGVVLIPDAKTYSGQTLVSEGILMIRNENALGLPRSEVQFIEVAATTGTFALEFKGATTAPIAFNAVDTDIKAALELLPTIGGVGGTVDVVTIPGAGITTFQITFGGTLQNSEQPAIDPIYVAPTSIMTVQEGTATLPEIQEVRVTAVGGNGINFGLVFNGQRTAAIPVNASATDVRNALWALSTIGTGNVQVTPSGLPGDITYRITFTGALATGNRPQIQSAVVGGTLVTQGTNMDGQRGTTVETGATLLIDAPMNFNFPNTGEIITLNGQGFDDGSGPMGALHIANGDVTFDSPLPILLGSDASIGVGRAGDTLFIESVISDSGGGHDLDIYGPGTVRYNGDGTGFYAGDSHTGYTGTTTVNSGTLLLNVTGANGILGPLVVGNSPVADGNALVRELQSNQIADTSTVRVNADGVFDLNGLTDTVSHLTMVGGDVFTRNGGNLTTGKIDMSAAAEIFVGNNATLTGGATKMVNSDIHVGTNSTVTLGDLDMNASDITFASPGPGTLNVGNVNMTNGSTITLPGGPLTINALDLFLDASTIDLNNASAINSRNVTLVNNALIDFDNTGKFIATGSVLVASGSDITFDLDGRFNITGNLTLQSGVVSLGNATAPNTALPTTGTLSAFQIDMTGATSVISIGNNGYLTAGSKVTNSAGDILLGSNAKFTAGGNVTLNTDALVQFGTLGSFNNQPFDLLIDNSDFIMADGGTAKTRNIALTADALIQFANSGKLESTGNTTMTGASDITFLNGGTATTNNLDITTGTISFLDNGTLNTANVNNTSAAISFGNGGKFNAGAVNVLNGTVRFGSVPNATYPFVSGGTLGAFAATGPLSLDGSTFSMGDNSTASMARFTLANASKAVFNDGVTVTDNGTLSVTGSSEILFGNTGKLVSGALTQNGGLISFRNGGTLDPAAVSNTGGLVTFLDNGTFTPDGVTAINASFTFGHGATINANGNVSLNQSELKTLTNANIDMLDLTTFGTAKVTVGDNSTVDTKAINVTGTGGTFTFGNNVAVTAVGNVAMANATGTWGSTGKLTATGNLNLSNTTLGFGDGSTVRVQGATANVDMSSASQINFTNTGTLRADGDLTMKQNSKLSFGTDGTVNVDDLSITTGNITMGAGADLLASGKADILGAAVSLGSGSLFDATGDVLISLNGASPASLVVGSNSTVETGKLTVATATLNVGANSFITTAGDVSVFVLTTGSSKVLVGSDTTFTVNGNVTSTNGTWTLQNNDTVSITGAASFTNGTTTFGTGGKLLADGDLTLNNSPITFGINGKIAVEDVFVHNKSKITFADGGTLTAAGSLNNNEGTVEVTGSSQIRFGTTGGAFTSGDVKIVDSQVTGGKSIALDIGGLDATRGTFTFGDGSGGTMDGDVNLLQSSMTLGNNANVSVSGSFTSENSAVAFGNNGSLAITGDAKLTLGTAILGDNFTFSAADAAFTDTSFSQGNTGSFTTADLTLTDSLLSLGSNIAGSVQDFGIINSNGILGSGTLLAIAGNITADSSIVGTISTLQGGGAIGLGTATHTIDVGNADGLNAVDFAIFTDISSSNTARLVKTGAGRLELAPPNNAVVDLTITTGDVQVTTGVGDVRLAGGTLSGNGETGVLDGPSGPAVGLVAPGDNWDVVKSGILTVGNAVWGPNTTYNVDLAGSIPGGSPVPGTNYDQLVVNGNIELGNALLTANYGPNILLNDSFTIINATGDVTGKFKQFNNQDILFVSGQKFEIEYTQHTVVLNKVRANATVSMTSSPNPSTLNQPVTLTATLVPELGAILFSGQMTVTFYDNGNAIASPLVNETTPGTFLAIHTFTSLTVGSHTLTATFNGDADNFNPSNTQPPQVVHIVEQPFAEPLTGGPSFLSPNNPSSVGVQDVYTFSTTVQNERGAIDWQIDIANSSNVVVRTITGSGTPDVNNTIAIQNITWDGKSNASVFVPDGLYTATFSVNDDQFGNVFSATPITITVDNTSPAAALNTPSPVAIDPTGTSVLQPATVISGSVSDTNLTSWIVSIRNGATLLRSYSGTGTNVNVTWNGLYDPLDATDPVNPTVQAPDAAYTVTVTAFDAAANTTTSSSQTVVVLSNGPIVNLASNSPTVYGQSYTLTATVTLPPGSPSGLTSLLAGDTVQFFRGATLLGTGTLTFNAGLGVYQASLPQPTLNAGTYSDFTAVYVQSADFPQGVSGQATHIVTPAPLVVTADNKTRTYGAANPTFTYTVSGLVNGDVATSVLGGPLSTPATVTSNVGTYPIEIGMLAPNGNYTISTFNNGTLTITPAGLTLQIDNKTRRVNTPNPAFTFTVIGLLNGDPASVVSSLPMNTVPPTSITSQVGSYPIVATGPAVLGSNYTVANIIPGTLEITPVLTNFAVGAGASIVPTQPSSVNVFSPTGSLVRSFTPFGAFSGGIRTAVADFTGDGIQDVAVATGPGAVVQVTVFDGSTGAAILNVFPFEPPPGSPSSLQFTGGAFVAAGDIDADGIAELVVTPDQGGGPRVIAYKGGTFAPFISYFGINDPNFRGGARAGVGDMNGDGYAEIAVSAGFEGGPRISVWDGKALTAAQFQNVMPDFFAFDQSLRNGAYVAIGDVNGDGFGDLIAGAGPGGGPHVKIFSGQSLINPNVGPDFTQPFASFFAGNPDNRGGVRVAAKVFDNDLFVDVVTGAGDLGGDTSTTYLGKDIMLNGAEPDDYFALDFPGLNNNGVFVG